MEHNWMTRPWTAADRVAWADAVRRMLAETRYNKSARTNAQDERKN
jgi:hypothetical protein